MALSPHELQALIPFIALLPLAGATVNGLFGARLPRGLVGALACLAVLGSFAICVAVFVGLLGDPETRTLSATLYTWIRVGEVDIAVRLCVDPLSAVMTLVITGVGFVIHVYSLGYMAPDPAVARYFAYLNLFVFAMLVLVLGDSLPLMFVGWEGVGVCSYLLIGFWYTDAQKAKAGTKAFIVGRIGDVGFIVAMLVLYRFAGDLGFTGLRQVVAEGGIGEATATAVCLLLVLGTAGKSAQLPLHVWLPDAMVGPTPVSALVHAATMVTAGVYLTARMGFVFAIAPAAMLTLAVIGAATALFAATIATAQNDIKKVLAYSTVSQLGIMFIAAGVGAYAVAVFHAVTHALFKACLFLGSGSVIRGMGGERDIRHMGGLREQMPITFATFLVATAAITGFPLLSGFISNDAILWNAFVAGQGRFAETFGSVAIALYCVGVVAAGLTAFYMWRLVFVTFLSGPCRARAEVASRVRESPPIMTVPLVVLAVAAVSGGALCWPHTIGHGNAWLAGWLAPSVGAVPTPRGNCVALEWGLMAASIVVALLGLCVAFVAYAAGTHPASSRLTAGRPQQWLYERLLGKWHVDELYEITLTRPITWLSKNVLYEGFDRRLIDGTVSFLAWFVRSVGFFVQVFQSGNVQRYLAIFAVGLAIVLYGWLGAPGSPAPAPAPVPALGAAESLGQWHGGAR